MSTLYTERNNTKWSEEEINFLTESWGQQSVTRIARRLKRSNNAIKSKVYELKLGKFLDACDCVPLYQFIQAMGSCNVCKIKSLIRQRDFPINMQKVNKRNFRTVKIDEFWKWAEKNMYAIDFSEIEKNILGNEPEWVANKRKLDNMRNKLVKNEPWTKNEDYMLEALIKKQCYTYYDLMVKLRRTAGAIQSRCIALKIKDRPVPQEKRIWTNDEIGQIKEMILEGYGYELTCFEFKVNDRCIRTLISRIFGTENLDKVREKIKIEMEDGYR